MTICTNDLSEEDVRLIASSLDIKAPAPLIGGYQDNQSCRRVP